MAVLTDNQYTLVANKRSSGSRGTDKRRYNLASPTKRRRMLVGSRQKTKRRL